MLTFFAADGSRIIVGQNARENDRISGSMAGTDLWFHAHGVPGAHVVLTPHRKGPCGHPCGHPGGHPCGNDEAIHTAAALAVKHSKAPMQQSRSLTMRPVDVCFGTSVSKARGAAPGAVDIRDAWIVHA